MSVAVAVAQRDGWTKPFPAHKIAGNLHYVGTGDLACFLIATPEGHILLNSGLSEFQDIGILARVQNTKALKPDIWVAAHASHYGMQEKLRKGSFIDPEGYRQAVEQFEKLYRQRLAKERDLSGSASSACVTLVRLALALWLPHAKKRN